MKYVGVARNDRERKQALIVAAKSFYQDIKTHNETLLRKEFLLCEHPGYTENSPIIVCAPNGDVIASAFLIDCKLPFANRLLEAVFISSISVDESSRGKGVSLVLMEAAIKAATSYNKDIAMLIARRVVDNYYTRFGFFGVAQYSKTVFSMSTLPHKKGLTGSIVNKSLTTKDLAICAALYSQSYKGLLGHCLRNSKMWGYILHKLPYLGMHLDLITVDQKVTGYAIHDGRGGVYEIATGEDPPVCGAYFFLQAIAPECDNFTLHVPPAHPFLAGLKGADVSLTLRECPYGGHMVSILNPALLDSLNDDEPAKVGSISFDQTTRALQIARITDIGTTTDLGTQVSFNIPLLDQI
jgi:predicted acetyltransferase